MIKTVKRGYWVNLFLVETNYLPLKDVYRRHATTHRSNCFTSILLTYKNYEDNLKG